MVSSLALQSLTLFNNANIEISEPKPNHSPKNRSMSTVYRSNSNNNTSIDVQNISDFFAFIIFFC